MTGQELSSYIKRAESVDDPSATVLALLKDIEAGRVKAEDVQAHYRAEYVPRLGRMSGMFGAGTLFKAQKQSFLIWLDGKDYRSDFQTYLEFRATLDMCKERGKRTALPAGMSLFIYKMVLPSPVMRKERAEHFGMERYREGWQQMQQREGWIGWRQ